MALNQSLARIRPHNHLLDHPVHHSQRKCGLNPYHYLRLCVDAHIRCRSD